MAESVESTRVEVRAAVAMTPVHGVSAAGNEAVHVPRPQVAAIAPAPAQVLPRARLLEGERAIAKILRGGAILSGAAFLGSLVFELLPQSETVSVAIDGLRKGAISLLLVTPIVRLVAAGVLLSLRGEWRYAVYAAAVLSLLGIAIGTGFTT